MSTLCISVKSPQTPLYLYLLLHVLTLLTNKIDY